ncbi:hypothetical protein Tco_1418037 [Tanacetum coccineum]
MGQLAKALRERPQGALPSNIIPNPQEDIKVITTRSGITLAGLSVPPPNSSFSKELLEIFKKLHFNINLEDALAQMLEYGKMLKDLLTNKEKLLELTDTPLNENCLAVLLNKLLEKLGDPGKFLIPCYFKELEVYMSLADLGWISSGSLLASLSLTMTSILVSPYLRETILEDGPTSKYPHKHADESINQIAIIDTTCEDHFHEVLNVQKSIHPLSGNPTPSSDPVVASLSPSLTPFGDSDFLLEETDAFLALDYSIPPEIDNGIYDSEGDILFLKNY